MLIFGKLDAKLVELFGRLCVTFSVLGSTPTGTFVPFRSEE